MRCLVLAAALRLVRRETRDVEPFVVPLENFAGAQYLMNITVGGQPITVIPDSGSFGLLVTSTRCADCPQKTLQVDDLHEDAYESKERTTSVSFGSGKVDLQLATADVTIGQLEAAATVWEIVGTDAPMAAMWRGARFSGILGLGYADEDKGRPSLLTELGIDQFALCYGSGYWAGANLHFATLYPEQEQFFADVVPNEHDHWLLRVFDVRADPSARPLSLCSADGPECLALIDSGTSDLMIPPTHVNVVLSMIGEVKSDCSNYDSLPDLTLKLGGPGQPALTLPKEAYVRKMVSGGLDRIKERDGLNITWEKTPIVKICILKVGSAMLKNEPRPVWILGMPFFRAHLVSFDRKQRRVGVSKQPCETGPLETRKHHVTLQRGAAHAPGSPEPEPDERGVFDVAPLGPGAERFLTAPRASGPSPPAPWDVVSPGLVLA